MRLIITQDGKEILLPKNDFLFKLIFGDARNKELVKGFLQAVLSFGEEEFELEFLDTHLKPDFIADKLCIIDIRLKTATGKQTDIEMQLAQTANVFERVCFYKSKMIVEQLGEGDWYDSVKKVINIIVADFNFIEGGDKNRYHHCYRLMDSVDGTCFGDVEEIHVLELPKLTEASERGAVWEWAKFIGAESEEDLEMVAQQNELMKKAVKELYRISSDADVRRQYEQREKAWRDEQARTAYALQTGRAEGLAEGAAEREALRRKLAEAEAALERLGRL
jgi:predicted transposase/invertase (TIGR01784 family)